MGTGNTIGDLWWWHFHFFFFPAQEWWPRLNQLPSECPLPITAWFPSLREKQQIITSPHLTFQERGSQGNTQAEKAIGEVHGQSDNGEPCPGEQVPGLLLFSSSQLITDAQVSGTIPLATFLGLWIIPVLGVSENDRVLLELIGIISGVGKRSGSQGYFYFPWVVLCLGNLLHKLPHHPGVDCYYKDSALSVMWGGCELSRGAFCSQIFPPSKRQRCAPICSPSLSIFLLSSGDSQDRRRSWPDSRGGWRLTGIPSAPGALGDSEGNDLCLPPWATHSSPGWTAPHAALGLCCQAITTGSDLGT